jgi:hypothetical protein
MREFLPCQETGIKGHVKCIINATDTKENVIRQQLYMLCLSLFEPSLGNSLALIHFSRVSGGLKWVGSRWQRLEVCAVLLLGLMILVRAL